MRANISAVAMLALVPIIGRVAGPAALRAEHAQLPDLRSENVAVIALSPGGEVVATGERASLVKLWDGQTRRLDRTIRAHGGPVSSLAFSPDGRWLVSGGTGRTATLWDMKTGERSRTLSAGADFVRAVAFSGDGSTIVVVAISPDARALGAAVGDETIKVLPLK